MSAVAASSVAALLVEDPRTIGEALHRRLLELDLESATGLPSVGGGDPGDDTGFDVVRRVAEALAGFLTMPLGDFVAAAWQQQPAVQHACRQTDGRPGATRRIDVGEHTLECVQRPCVELDLAGARTPVLDVAVTVALAVERVTVDVEAGQVVAVGAGQGSCVAELALARPGERLRRVFVRETAALALSAYRCPRARPVGPARSGFVGPEVTGAARAGIPGAHWGRLST